MNTITIRNNDVQMPAAWNELTRRNLLYLTRHFPWQNNDEFPVYFFFHCMELWKRPKLSMDIAKNFIISKRLNRDYKDEVAMEFGEKNFWEQQIILTIAELDNFAWLNESQEMERNLFPYFRHGLKKYYGPSDLLANVTADEFKDADDFLKLYLEEKDEKFLHYLLAVLWREKAKNPTSADVRVPYSDFEVEKRAQTFSKLDRATKYACLLNYIGLRIYFINRPKSKIVFSSSGSSSSSDGDFGTILLRLAENHTFGNHKEVKKTFIHDIIDHLADLKKREKHDTK